MHTRDDEENLALIKNTDTNLTETSTYFFITKKLHDLRTAMLEREPASMRPAWPKRVVLPTVIESSWTLSSAGASFYFTKPDISSTAWLKTPFSPAIVTIVLGALFRAFNFDSNFMRFMLSRTPRCAMTLIAGYTTRYVLFHEGGHALSALALFINSRPEISIEPGYLGAITGSTKYYTTELTDLGQKIGFDASKSIIRAAGMGTNMLEAVLFLILSGCIPDQWLETKDFLRVNAYMNIFGTMTYFLTSYFSTCEAENDACSLNQDGFPPYAGLLLVLLSTALLELALYFIPKGYSYLKDQFNHRQDQEDRVEELEPCNNDIRITM